MLKLLSEPYPTRPATSLTRQSCSSRFLAVAIRQAAYGVCWACTSRCVQRASTGIGSGPGSGAAARRGQRDAGNAADCYQSACASTARACGDCAQRCGGPHRDLPGQLRVTLQAIARFDQEIAAVAPTLPDYSLFNTLPGSGPILTPRLQTAFGEQRERFQNAGQLQRYSGVAPVTQRSGKKSWVHWRWQCPIFVRQTFVEWAAQTINKSFWAGAYYRQQRAKGSSHQVAVRALAFKWIRIVHRCWQTRTPYDESRYLMALQLRGSPLVAGLPAKTTLRTDSGRERDGRPPRNYAAKLPLKMLSDA